ncbi:hypothetical protein [Rhodococcus sp. UNC363MFTsu5.1]|uniref:hypothetical protein n=1 Tax=Rhodococcus sp. UNC363MFTsu5.1 TaxID=1449069 RepID=UPI0004852082|nr:hypothetical protein [Rhodococcus sp. UNC363MFTsu5.1]
MITVLCCRGIGEPLQNTMLSGVTRRLDPARFRAREVPWLAEYGPAPRPGGAAFEASLSRGKALLLNMINDDPYPVVLLGYSGGAALAGHVGAEIGRGLHPGLDVRGVGLVSDPFRSPLNGGPADSMGVAGARPVLARFPVWQVADPADVICCCPPDSPLRTFADQTAAFSLVDPGAWGMDLLDRARRTRWQPSGGFVWQDPLAPFRRAAQAVRDAEGYLFRGDHTGYGVRRAPGSHLTYLDQLADNIMRSVR